MPKKLVKLDCGKHWGETPGPCRKCNYFNSDKYRKLVREGCQYDGTPWMAIFAQ